MLNLTPILKELGNVLANPLYTQQIEKSDALISIANTLYNDLNSAIDYTLTNKDDQSEIAHLYELTRLIFSSMTDLQRSVYDKSGFDNKASKLKDLMLEAELTIKNFKF